MCLEDTTRIPLYARMGAIIGYTLVDAADAPWVNRWTWHLTKGYVSRGQQIGGQYRTIRLHRELLGLTFKDGLEADHINRCKTDNRRTNLRVVTRAQQMQNISSPPGSTSKYRGVSWHKKAGKWIAYGRSDGKYVYHGLFTTEQEAAEVAREARLRLLPFAVD